jgi:hypothetical protein
MRLSPPRAAYTRRRSKPERAQSERTASGLCPFTKGVTRGRRELYRNMRPLGRVPSMQRAVSSVSIRLVRCSSPKVRCGGRTLRGSKGNTPCTSTLHPRVNDNAVVAVPKVVGDFRTSFPRRLSRDRLLPAVRAAICVRSVHNKSGIHADTPVFLHPSLRRPTTARRFSSRGLQPTRESRASVRLCLQAGRMGLVATPVRPDPVPTSATRRAESRHWQTGRGASSPRRGHRGLHSYPPRQSGRGHRGS